MEPSYLSNQDESLLAKATIQNRIFKQKILPLYAFITWPVAKIKLNCIKDRERNAKKR